MTRKMEKGIWPMVLYLDYIVLAIDTFPVGKGEGGRGGEGGGDGEGEGDIDIMNTTCDKHCYILPIDCILIALDAHMSSHSGSGPGTIAIMAAYMCMKGNQ